VSQLDLTVSEVLKDTGEPHKIDWAIHGHVEHAKVGARRPRGMPFPTENYQWFYTVHTECSISVSRSEHFCSFANLYKNIFQCT